MAVDEHDKNELELYLENTGELYEDKKKIIGDMIRRMERGALRDPASMWLPWVTKGARMYRREIGTDTSFPLELRSELAKDLAEKYADGIRRHEYAWVIEGGERRLKERMT
jgi:hypothetical protein